MLLRKNLDPRILLILGSALTSLRIVLQNFLDRSGRSTDTTDFLMGMLLGLGLGFLMLFVWCLGRQKGSGSGGAKIT